MDKIVMQRQEKDKDTVQDLRHGDYEQQKLEESQIMSSDMCRYDWQSTVSTTRCANERDTTSQMKPITASYTTTTWTVSHH
jgi:hypothetical protein